MELMANIVTHLPFQDSLPTHLQQLVDFFFKWNYNAITVDVFLKTCFNVFRQFVPNNPPQVCYFGALTYTVYTQRPRGPTLPLILPLEAGKKTKRNDIKQVRPNKDASKKIMF